MIVFKYVSVGTRLNTDNKLILLIVNAVATVIGNFGLFDFDSYSHHFLNNIYHPFWVKEKHVFSCIPYNGQFYVLCLTGARLIAYVYASLASIELSVPHC